LLATGLGGDLRAVGEPELAENVTHARAGA
jgi:hypothetical protein